MAMHNNNTHCTIIKHWDRIKKLYEKQDAH